MSGIGIDRAANRDSAKGRFVTAAYRAARAAAAPGRPTIVAKAADTVYRVAVDWVMGIDLPLDVEAGPGLAIFHGTGLVVHRSAVLGRDVVLRHGVTIGVLGEEGADGDAVAPRLGDRVSVGAGAILLGEITIGDDAVIGAGAVVLDDVPAGAVVVGNPGRVVRVVERQDR